MKLAIVRQHYRPDGGAERFVSRALQSLARIKALSVSVITRTWEQDNTSSYKIIICNPPIRSRLNREKAFARAAIELFPQFDLVQSHERIPGCHIYRAGDGVHRAWLQQRSRLLSPWRRYWLWHSRYHRYVMQQEEAMYRHPALRAVICNSKMVADEIKENFSLAPEKIALIYNGVDTKEFHPQLRQQYRESIREQLKIPQQAPVMLFVGSGFERKGLLGALHAISHKQEVHLIIVGKDKHQGRYQRIAKHLGIEKRIHFVGMQCDPKPYYGAADMLLLPTCYDPFPNVILEAMASGLGVITSKQCGGKEFIQQGKNGFICDALDYQSLQLSVSQAITLGTEKLGVAARDTVLPYDLEALSKNMQSLYTNLTADIDKS
ncbi:glycosyltransferase family 4 protein [Edwardsiella tarda]